MRFVRKHWLGGVLLGLLVAGAQGCGSEDVPVQELFAVRNQGLLFLQRGQLPEAEEQFSRLVDLAPDEPLGHANLGLTYLLITHNIAVVHQVASRIAVMHQGRIVEMGEARKILRAPEHDYTRLLLSSVPELAAFGAGGGSQ